MQRKWTSLLGGAAVAAFVIAPTVGVFGQTAPLQPMAANWPAPPPAPPMPAAPPMPPAPGHPGHWMVGPTQVFNTTAVKLHDIVGRIDVQVRDRGPMLVQSAGAPNRVKAVHVSQDGSTLEIDSFAEPDSDRSVWDWHNWFNFSETDYRQGGNLIVTVTVPRGASVRIDGLVGDASIGDTMGELRFEAAACKARIGRVSSAKISLAGTGRIELASVQGALDAEIGGSGKIVAGPTGSVKADIAGSGEAQFGPIARGLSLDIAGSGDASAAHVNGPVKIEIAGSGSVRIADGIADPLHVDMMGAGNVNFGGVAVDPHIDSVGAGSVRIKAYRGHLNSEGMADVKIGN